MKSPSPDKFTTVEIPLFFPKDDGLTAEQRDVLKRLEAYPHEFFNLMHTYPRSDRDCFVCVAGALGDFVVEFEPLRRCAGPPLSRSRGLMTILIGSSYGRGVPGVQDYPATRVPKQVAIDAVRAIFLMRE